MVLSTNMKLIIGLGNPGKEYENTRHNVGHMVIDALKKISLAKPDPALQGKYKALKPDVFMNDSGSFVAKTIKNLKLKIENLYIVHDDLDIPLGKFKIQFGRGPKDHNGIKSVNESLGTEDYWRVRVGIDNRPLDNKPMGEVYTLENFTEEEMIVLNGVIKEIASKLSNI